MSIENIIIYILLPAIGWLMLQQNRNQQNIAKRHAENQTRMARIEIFLKQVCKKMNIETDEL